MLSVKLSAALILVLLGVVVAQQCDPSYPYRRVDGACNNLVHPYWGVGHLSTGAPADDGILIRLEPADYSNVSSRSSPRDAVVSPVVIGVNRVHQPDEELRAVADVNTLFVFLGQFLVHDIVNTEIKPFNPFAPNEAATPPDVFGRNFTLGLKSNDRIDQDGIPQQFNLATSYIDLSPTYGVDLTVSNALRKMEDGLLLTTNRSTFTFTYTNFPNFDLCDCRNTTDNTPYYVPDGTGENTDDLYSSTIRGFAPEPFPFLNKCVSPAASFGTTTLPGGQVIPNTPGVYQCSFNQPPVLLPEIECSIRYDRIADPKWAPYTWNIPDTTKWQPFVAQTNPPVPFDLINSQTRDPNKALAAGDKRNSENFGILMISQFQLRIHNARAILLKQRNPTWNDEKLFQEARKWTIAVWQQIIYREYLPWLVGFKAHKHAKFTHKYDFDKDYDSEIDPRVSNMFSTAGFRMHAMVPKVLFPANPRNNYERIVANRTQVYSHFFGTNNPGTKVLPYLNLPFSGATSQFGPVDDFLALVASQMPTGLGPDDAIMAGLINQKANKLGHYVDRGLADLNIASCFTPHLFVSVPALTIFRGRNHGLPNYHKVREIYGRDSIYGKQNCPNPTDLVSPDPLSCFLRLTEGNTDLAQLLLDNYGRLDQIDPWFGLMVEAETSFRDDDALLSKSAAAMAIDQFQRLKYGDRFWYQNNDLHQFTEQDLEDLKNATLKSLIAAHFPGLAGYLPERDIFVGRDAFNFVK